MDIDDPLLDPYSTSEKDGYDDYLTNDVHDKRYCTYQKLVKLSLVGADYLLNSLIISKLS